MSEYLIILTTHIDNIEKRDIVIKTLQEFKDDNIDVCVSLHSNQYTSEIAKLVKYVCYDSNNTFIPLLDFYKNIHQLNNDNCTIGNHIAWLGFHNGFIENYTEPRYSKPALSLLRNGISIASANSYKWTVYLEYDVPAPINGYKNLIENKIAELEGKTADCFYYEDSLYGPPLIWPSVIIFNTEKIANNKKLMLNDWNQSTESWIKHWGNTSFEHSLQHCIKSEFQNDTIIKANIKNEYTIWGVSSNADLSRSYAIDFNSKINTATHIYPYKNKEGNFELYLLVFNSNIKNIIKNISVEYDGMDILSIPQLILDRNEYRLYTLPPIASYEKIKLMYDDVSEEFTVDMLETIYKYLIKMKFFSDER